MPPSRPTFYRQAARARVIAWPVALALLVLAILFRLDAPVPATTSDATAASTRLTEGRLTAYDEFAPLATVQGAAVSHPADWRRLAAAAAAQAVCDRDPTAANLQAFGSAALRAGQADVAVQAFEDAAVVAPDGADIQSDLAAAFLARSRIAGHAADAPRAIEAAARAMRLNPHLPSAAFNYALAVERLPLRHEAHRAWEAYLHQFDGSDGWAAEARRRRDAAAAAPPLEPPAPAARASSRLADWARAAQADPDRTPLPDFAGDGAFFAAIGAQLADSRGAARRDLALVVRDLVEGEAALVAPNYTTVNRLAASVLARSLPPESPLRLWALRLRLSAGFNTGTTMDQRAAVEELAEVARRHGFTALEADAEHRLGAFDFVAGRYERAHDHYAAGLRLRASLGNVRGTVASGVALADALRMLGRAPESWERYLANLQAGALGDVTLEITRLNSAATAGLVAALPAAALAFARESEHLAMAAGAIGPVTTSRVLQARAFTSAGDLDRAASMLRLAREALSRLDDPAISDRHLAEVGLTEAEVLARTSPSAAVPVIADAERRLSTNVGQRLLELAVIEARTFRALGEAGRARAALYKGVAIVDRQQQAIGQAEFLPSFIDASWDAFAELVDLEAGAGQHAEALRWLDRGLDIRRRWSRGLSATPLADISRQGPLVAYLVRPEVLWIWVVRQGAITSRRVTVPRSDLQRRTARLAHVLTLDGAPAAIDEAATELARDIWWPIAALLDEEGEQPVRVSLVLDPTLQRVPFAMLPWSAARDERVVDRAPTVLCPSLFACRAVDGPVGATARVAALHAGRGGDGLPALPTARAEAERVGRRYRRARVAPATEAALREALTTDDVVHFSGHAVADERYPRRSELLLERDGEASVRVPLHQLLSQPVMADLVVLSACRTSRAEARRGEGGIGVAGEFLRAGARHVLATQWDVRDDMAGLAMDVIHEALGGGAAPWDAVRRAQLELARDPALAAREWAGYVAYASVPPGP